MKELTIQEKAQAYDEAIERAKAMIKVANNREETYNSVITIFPELKESEDEGIRKALIEHVKGIYKGCCTEEASKERDMFLAWLEKQGEQNPAWSEEDEDYYDAIIAKLEVTQEDALLTDNQMNFLKSLKDRVHPQNILKPNEEQLRELHCVISGCSFETPILVELEEQLKKL